MCSATEQCQTELRADAVRQERQDTLTLSRNTLSFSLVYSLLSSLSWQVAQLLQVHRRHAVAAAV